MIKLLALDLDGTLLNSKGVVSDANRAAIRAAEDRGVVVGFGMDVRSGSNSNSMLRWSRTMERC